MAYERAGVHDPANEIDVAEVCDVTSFHESLWTEQLGLCTAGTGGRLVEEGVTALDGRLPVNPSGGLFGANPPSSQFLFGVLCRDKGMGAGLR